MTWPTPSQFAVVVAFSAIGFAVDSMSDSELCIAVASDSEADWENNAWSIPPRIVRSSLPLSLAVELAPSF